MPIFKEIKIEYGLTFSYGKTYVKPTVGFTVELAEGDNADEVIAATQATARRLVHEEIDRALVLDGQEPRFGTSTKADPSDTVAF
ncbi:MAG: hypothetical protein BroJett011_62400 [Chloroflexota bacterium]|nr:MAG: hypothetical protein BroJett011_62400 [Chloroflexota bacterium]